MDKMKEVVDVTSSNISHSVPTSTITKHSKSFLDKTPILKTDAPKWKTGVLTPLHGESLSPNQEAFGLLARFASSSVRMEGDAVQHLPVVQGNKSTDEMLNEVPWFSPTPKRKD